MNVVRAERTQCLIGSVPRVRVDRDRQSNLGRDGQERVTVIASVGGNAAERAFLKEVVLVVQGRYITQVNTGDGERATTIQRCERGWNETSHWREEYRCVEKLRWGVGRAAYAARTQGECQVTSLRRAGHHVHARPLGDGDLRGEVCGSSEAVDSESPARGKLRSKQGPVANDPRAEQGCGVHVIESRGNWIDVCFVHHDVLRITPVDVPPREGRRETEVLLARSTEATRGATSSQPRRPHSITESESRRRFADFIDDANDFVSGHDEFSARGEIAFGEV